MAMIIPVPGDDDNKHLELPTHLCKFSENILGEPSDELVEWFGTNNIAWTWQSWFSEREHSTVVLSPFIFIPDDKHRMLFKLTWL